MHNYALIHNGIKVGEQSSTNIISNPSLIFIEDMMPVDGSTYDAESKVFTAPVIAPEKIREISPDAMRDRFFFDERVLIDNSLSPKVVTFRNDLMFRRKPVSLDSPRFALAMQLLLSEQLIEVGRDITLLQDGTPDEAL